jgi:TrmH family RNA methyltransferase
MLSKRIVKYIQSLSHKKLRDEHGQFIAETPKVVAEFLSGKIFKCSILCAAKGWISENEDLLKSVLTGNIYEVDEIALKKVSLLKTPNKVLAVFDKRPVNNGVLQGKLSLMLDDIQDPGNLGTIIRIADWFGVGDIICSENCADCYNPKVVQASMGSLARINTRYTSLNSFMEDNKDISVYAATLSGRPISVLKNMEEGIILIGNESRGISEELLQKATMLVTIPRFGRAESLNAAVATGIILSQIKIGGP